MNIFIQIIIYTFFIFGIIVFIQEIGNLISIKKDCKLIIVLDNEEEVESIFRIYKSTSKNFKNTYIFIDERNIKDHVIIDNIYLRHKNIMLKRNDLSNILDN